MRSYAILTSLDFIFPDENEIMKPSESPKPTKKTRVASVAKSDTRPRSIPISITNDPLMPALWAYVITFLDDASIGCFKRSARLINLVPMFVNQAQYKYQTFLHSLPTPKVIYYSRAQIFAKERASLRAALKLTHSPDLHNPDPTNGFTLPGRKI